MKDLEEQPNKGKFILVMHDALGTKNAVWVDNWAVMPGVIIFLRNGATVAEQNKGGLPVAVLPLNESTKWAVVSTEYVNQVKQEAYEQSKMDDANAYLKFLDAKFGKNKGKLVTLPDGVQVVVPMTDEEMKELEGNDEKKETHFGCYR